MKTCKTCKEDKTLDNYSKYTAAADNMSYDCRDCQSEHRKKHKEYYRDWHLMRKYGITNKDYEDMKDSQNGRCLICSIEEKHCEYGRFAVDHNHETGEIRGLLCKKCNQAIGLLQDNAEFCRSAANYLGEKID